MYQHENFKTFKVDSDGERTLLCNFIAQIISETRYIDGVTQETYLDIIGQTANPEDPDNPIEWEKVEVPALTFASLSWVMPAWGTKAIIQPGGSIKEDIRTSIQLFSTPTIKNVYRHIGWTKLNGEPAYLHQKGAITGDGNREDVEVLLPAELSRYNLLTTIPVQTGIAATLDLITIGPREVTWPLLAATLAPLYGPVDFAIHVTGRTGTYKSELLSLFQSHFGSEMDARHLPGSWSSTPNALEAQAFLTANAVFCIDDFVPSGTSYQQKAYQTSADKLVRSQGNQAGRARLTDTSHLQTTMYPRGIILSTGEDTPEGHSVRARMLILELSPGDITPTNLSKAQKARKLYTATTAGLIQYLANHPNDLRQSVDSLRAKYLTIGHTRTPSMLARLVATIQHFLVWCELNEAIPESKRLELTRQATAAILASGEKQQQYLEAADPVDVFCGLIRQVLASGQAHFRTINGGIPMNPTLVGWTSENSMGEMPTFKSRGPCIGWINWNADEMYLDIIAGFAIVKKVGGSEVSLTKQTMLKRLKDAGMLVRTDETRQRNTVRITAEGHARQVLCLSLSTVLDTQEKPNEEADTTF